MMMDNLLSSFGKMDTDSIIRRARDLREADFTLAVRLKYDAEYKFKQENIKKLQN
jgi:hypothetical protein